MARSIPPADLEIRHHCPAEEARKGSWRDRFVPSSQPHVGCSEGSRTHARKQAEEQSRRREEVVSPASRIQTASRHRRSSAKARPVHFRRLSIQPKPQRTVLALLDYSKAFDTVSRRELLRKMLECGVPNHWMLWMKAFLMNRLARVRWGDESSTNHRM